MSRARDVASLLNSDSKIEREKFEDTRVVGRRNLIINGAMQVAQRGTSVTAGGGGYNTVDRMRTSQQSTGFTAIDQSQSTDAPDGFSYSLKWVNSGANSLADGKSAYLEYAIEGQDIQHLQYGKSSAKKTTLSFWVKNSIAGTYGITLSRVDETRSNVKTYTVDTADTWEHKTVTFEGDTTTAVPNDNTRGLNIYFMLRGGSNHQTSSTGWQAGSNKTTSSQTDWPATDDAEFYITGVQLEVGEKATPFEHRSFGDELALCKRYYAQTDEFSQWGFNRAGSAGVPVGTLFHEVEMRAAPTVTDDGGWTTGGGYQDDVSYSEITTKKTRIVGTESITAGTSEWIHGGIIYFDAEL